MKQRKQNGFTLTEILASMTIMSLILLAIVEINQVGVTQWKRYLTSSGGNTQATIAFDRMVRDIRNSVSMSAESVGSNTVYTFTLPSTTDSEGYYLPVSTSLGILYHVGPKVRYYLSDLNGAMGTTGGTILWKANLAAGASSWVVDVNWANAPVGHPNCPNVQAFTMSSVVGVTATAQINLTVNSIEGNKTTSYALSRQVAMINNNVARTTLSVDPKATFLQATTDSAAPPNPLIMTLSDLGITAGNRVRLEVLGGYSEGSGSADDSSTGNNNMNFVFSSSNTVNVYTLASRVPGAVSPSSGGSTFTSWNSTADISQDFRLGSPEGVVVVPTGATHLMIGTVSALYGDNTDANQNYKVRITEL